MKYWNYWLVVLLVVLFVAFYLKSTYPEGFEDSYPGYNVTINYENVSKDIADRHPIQSSLVQDLNLRYKKAYNYELENKAYQEALIKTFTLGKSCLVKNDYTEDQPVNRTLNHSIKEAYVQATEVIQQQIKSSPYFDLPDGSLQIINPIQMVHDKLVGYQIHKTIPDHILLYIDAIFYREAKYHGKHVAFIVLAQKNKKWDIKVMDATVKGVIFEDQIALFPVQANDAYQKNEDLSFY